VSNPEADAKNTARPSALLQNLAAIAAHASGAHKKYRDARYGNSSGAASALVPDAECSAHQQAAEVYLADRPCVGLSRPCSAKCPAPRAKVLTVGSIALVQGLGAVELVARRSARGSAAAPKRSRWFDEVILRCWSDIFRSPRMPVLRKE
jgi:hypothetical protein